MNALVGPLHLLLLVLPVLGHRLPRRQGLQALTAALGASVLLLLWLHDSPTFTTMSLGGKPLLGLDELSLWLLPPCCLIALALALCAPTAERSPLARRTLMLGLGVDLLFCSTRSPWLLAVLWPCAHLPLLARISEDRLRRILSFYFVPEVIAFALGAVAIAVHPDAPPLWALGAVTAAIVLRKAIFPVHQWLPELFERAPLDAVIAFSTPQLGAYATMRLLAPWAPHSLLVGLGGAALVTSVYGACLAFGQVSLRRVYAGLFMGQTSLVFAGLQCTSRIGLTGGLCLWISGGLALTGLGLAVWALEARRGPFDLTVYHGGYAMSPMLANSFLILALTCVGFPGTLGFVSQELLLDGTVGQYPHVGVLVAVATTLNAITIMRIYGRLFCGRSSRTRLGQRLRVREKLALYPLVALVLLFGLLPQPFALSRWRAADALIQLRESGPRALP